MGDGAVIAYRAASSARPWTPTPSTRPSSACGNRSAAEIRLGGRGYADAMSESVEAGRRVRLPAGAEPPIKVFVNGTEQAEGADYTLRGNEILFSGR